MALKNNQHKIHRRITKNNCEQWSVIKLFFNFSIVPQFSGCVHLVKVVLSLSGRHLLSATRAIFTVSSAPIHTIADHEEELAPVDMWISKTTPLT